MVRRIANISFVRHFIELNSSAIKMVELGRFQGSFVSKFVWGYLPIGLGQKWRGFRSLSFTHQYTDEIVRKPGRRTAALEPSDALISPPS